VFLIGTFHCCPDSPFVPDLFLESAARQESGSVRAGMPDLNSGLQKRDRISE